MKNIAIFASGTGSNADRILLHFETVEDIDVRLVVCNNPKAGVVDVAERRGVELLMWDNDAFVAHGAALVRELHSRKIDVIVLAGFLRKIPSELIEAYSGRIINIHPALLPKFGGKGMYGKRVHEAVLAAGEKETGITIHHVTEEYDEGSILFQASFPIENDDKVEDIERKIHQLEHHHFPKVIEDFVRSC